MSNRKPDASDFYTRVWKVVEKIPPGYVTTYGHIAEHLGARRSARMVGWAMNAASGRPIPCHRVVNQFGGLTGARHFGGAFVMEDILRGEGVEFDGDGCVLMDEHLWIPGKRIPEKKIPGKKTPEK